MLYAQGHQGTCLVPQLHVSKKKVVTLAPGYLFTSLPDPYLANRLKGLHDHVTGFLAKAGRPQEPSLVPAQTMDNFLTCLNLWNAEVLGLAPSEVPPQRAVLPKATLAKLVATKHQAAAAATIIGHLLHG